MIAADSTNGSATSAIKKAIEKCGATYTLNDVEKAVTDAGGNLTRTQISQALSRLAKDSAIRIQTPGQGRRPTIFTKEVPTS